jgi:hypothetical protein
VVSYPRARWRRRRQAESNAPRPLGCFWPLFWLILLVVLLGLLFGGYRKGTKTGAPQRVAPVTSYSDSAYAGTYPLGRLTAS